MMSASATIDVVRRVAGGVVTLAVLGVAVAVFVAPVQGESARTAEQRREVASSQPPEIGTATAGGSSTLIQSADFPTVPLPDGPGIDQPGIVLSAEVLPDGRIEVAEEVRLTQPTARIRLQAPAVESVSVSLGTARPRIDDLRMAVDNLLVELPEQSFTDESEVTLEQETTTYQLRYTLSGVTVRTGGDDSGRALGAIGPVSPGDGRQTAVQVLIEGDGVRTVTCPRLPSEEQICASAAPDGGYLVMRLDRNDAMALIQADID